MKDNGSEVPKSDQLNEFGMLNAKTKDNQSSLMDEMYIERGSGTSAREAACVNKQHGQSCQWIADNGSTQTGKCIYNKWGLRPGKLFCAKADYLQEGE